MKAVLLLLLVCSVGLNAWLLIKPKPQPDEALLAVHYAMTASNCSAAIAMKDQAKRDKVLLLNYSEAIKRITPALRGPNAKAWFGELGMELKWSMAALPQLRELDPT